MTMSSICSSRRQKCEFDPHHELMLLSSHVAALLKWTQNYLIAADTGRASALADWKRCVRATEATKTIVLRKISF